MIKLFAFGINHKYAPIELREKLAFAKMEIPTALLRLKDIEIFRESLLLSTCNRVEIYGVTDDLVQAREQILDFLSLYHAVEREILRRATYFYEEEQAARHLFRVSSGLDSMVVGENEILGQVKESFRLASEAGNVKSLLHQLFERAFRTAKKTRQETKISEGAVSVSSVAVELAEKIFGHLSQKNILVLGSGKVSELTLKRLLKAESRVIWVASRNFDRTEEIGRRYGIQPIFFEDWKNYLKEADIVISSTAAPHPIIHYEDVKQVMALRKHKPLLIIDIAVPRNAEEKVNTLDDIYLYNIDDLQNVCDSNLKFRRKEIAKCEAIIDKQVEEFIRWIRQLESAPTVRKLQVYLDQIIAGELKVASQSESPEKVEMLRRVLERVKGKLLHDPLSKLKEVQSHGGGYHYHEALHTLFDLEKVKLEGERHHEKDENSDRESRKQAGSLSSRESSG